MLQSLINILDLILKPIVQVKNVIILYHLNYTLLNSINVYIVKITLIVIRFYIILYK